MTPAFLREVVFNQEIGWASIGKSRSGIWFAPNTTSVYPESPHLTLAYYAPTGVNGAISVGTAAAQRFGFLSGSYLFDPKDDLLGTTNKRFEQILSGSQRIYCYQNLENQYMKGMQLDQIIYVQVSSNNELKFEILNGFNGTCPADGDRAFTGAALIYTR